MIFGDMDGSSVVIPDPELFVMYLDPLKMKEHINFHNFYFFASIVPTEQVGGLLL